MTSLLKKSIIYILCIAILIGVAPPTSFGQEIDDGSIFEEEYIPPENEGDIFDDAGQDPKAGTSTSNIVLNQFKKDFSDDIYSYDTSSKYYLSPKIILNSSDRQILDNMSTIYSLLPNLTYDIDKLSEFSGKSVEELEEMSNNDVEAYSKIVTDTAEKKFSETYIKTLVLSNPSAMMIILNLSSESQAIQEVANNKKDVEAAIDDILAVKIDKRVIETLNYLVRPKDDPRGGAGHSRIKVDRLFKNYSREQSKYSRESTEVMEQNDKKDESKSSSLTIEAIKAEQNVNELEDIAQANGLSNQNNIVAGQILDTNGKTVSDFLVNTEESPANISSHYKGQAIDISEIDQIKCTKIERKRIGSDKKTAEAPYNIRLAWQTKEGYASDRDSINSSFNDLMWNQSQDAMLSMLSELNIDFENIDSLESASFSDMAQIIGQAFFASALNAPGGDIWNFSLSDTLRKLGGALLADKLSLERKPFLDTDISSFDSLSEAVGRYAIEKKLGLPYGALKGGDRDKMLANLGRARILEELKLPSDTLNAGVLNQEDLLQKIGSRIIENTMALNSGTFYGKSTLSEIKNSGGKYKIEAFLALARDVDTELNLPAGTTQKLKNGSMSVADYNRSVGMSALVSSAYIYGNYDRSSDPAQTPTVSYANGINQINWRDEMYNLPKGTIDKFVKASLSEADYRQIGIETLSRKMENSDLGRVNLKKWLASPNSNFIVPDGTLVDPADSSKTVSGEVALPLPTYSSILGLPQSQIYGILGTGEPKASAGAFKALGKKILTEALRKSSIAQKQIQSTLAKYPELQEGIEKYEFYSERINNIKSHLDIFKQKGNELYEAVRTADDSLFSAELKMSLLQSINGLYDGIKGSSSSSDLSTFKNIAEMVRDRGNSGSAQATSILDIITSNANARINNITTKVNAYTYELEFLLRNSYEILTGEVQSNFRFEDLSINEMSFGRLQLAGTSVSSTDLAMLLSGKIAPKDFLISVGSAKIADELGLPPKALKYASIFVEEISKKNGNTKEAFFRAIGLAALEGEINDNGQVLSLESSLSNFAGSVSFSSLRARLAEKLNGNTSRADSIIAKSLNLSDYNLNNLARGDFGAWSGARAKAEENDKRLNLPIGTTESFIRNKPLASAAQLSVNDDNYRQFATALGISESSLRVFISEANGEENPAINKIYYVDNNKYIEAPDTDNLCAEKAIPNDSYLYYDQDGMHNFRSFAEANEYQRNHTDRAFGDYLDEIARALSAKLTSNPGFAVPGSDISSLKSALSAYIEGQNGLVFADVSAYNSIKTFLESTASLEPSLIDKFFSRSSVVDSTDSANLDYLKALGTSLIKNYAASYIGRSIGINLGSSRLSADDIYDVFSGNSREVLGRIGGQLLDSELDLERGTMVNVISSSNSASRKCALEQAAAQILGKYINIPGLKIDGNIFNNFGGGKIESLLGFPEGSFRGASISELLDKNRRNYVPLIDFYEAFHLPVPKALDALADSALLFIGQDYASSHSGDSFYDKSRAINAYVEALGSDKLNQSNNSLWINWFLIDNTLSQNLSALLTPEILDFRSGETTAKLAAVNGFADYSNEELFRMGYDFENRLSSIDSALSLPFGKTNDLLRGAISPDNYRREVSNNSVTNLSVDIIKAAFGIESDINARDVINFKDAVLGFGRGDISGLPTVYEFLNKTFSLNLDEKAGFEQGTLASLIQRPDQAYEIILSQGAKKLDSQLGIDDKPINFSYFADIYVGDDKTDTAICSTQYINGSANFDECINSRRMRINVAARDAVQTVAARQISNFLSDVSGAIVTVTSNTVFGQSVTYDDKRYGITLDIEQIKGIFRGDYRALEAIAAVRALGSIIGDENGRYQLGNNSEGFLFDPQDIIFAIYGDSFSDSYAQKKAEDRIFAERNQNNNDEYVDFIISDDLPNIPLTRGAQTPPNAMLSTTGTQDAALKYWDNYYTLPAGADTSRPIFPSQDDPNYIDKVIAYNNTMDEAYRAGQEAIAQNRKLVRELFEYRASDCLLRKIDKNIPAGFSWNMLKGSNYVRTTTMLSYLENWMLNDSKWAEILTPGSFTYIYQYFHGDQGGNFKGDFDRLIRNTSEGLMNIVDDYLVQNSPVIMNISLAPGTAQGLFAFAKNGNFETPVTIGNESYSLKSVYDDYANNFIGDRLGAWADEKFGLPAGSSYSFYKSFRALENAKRINNLVSGWKVGDTISAAQSKISGLTEGTKLDDASLNKVRNTARENISNFKSEIVSLVINTLFSDQIASAEESLGLVPGTGAIAVGIMVSYLMGAAFNPIAAIMFVALNLFGVYRVDLVCTADGYYPRLEEELDSARFDNGGLGLFDGMNERVREQKFIEAAQYKTDRLALDLYEMPARTGREDLVPLQVMTGRSETAAIAKPLVLDTACNSIGSKSFMKNSEGSEIAVCNGTYVGIWQNIQNVKATHIGF